MRLRVFACVATLAATASSPVRGSGIQQSPAQTAFEQGLRLAEQTRQESLSPDGVALLANTLPIGYLIAEGDSWFAYPGMDVIGALEGQTLPGRAYYRVYSAASAGDTVESMAYHPGQRRTFLREYEKVRDAGMAAQLKAVLLSGGGNDIAGQEFSLLLNHARAAGTTTLDDAIVTAVIDRIGRSMETLIGVATHNADAVLGIKRIRIVIHGYADPVPDGRPYGIGWFLPGPWLQPGFTVKGYPIVSDQDLAANATVMSTLIDRFNTRMRRIPEDLKGVANVRYVDVRKLLNNRVPDSAYKVDWSNELHPTNAAFKRVAEAIHGAIQQP